MSKYKEILDEIEELDTLEEVPEEDQFKTFAKASKLTMEAVRENPDIIDHVDIERFSDHVIMAFVMRSTSKHSSLESCNNFRKKARESGRFDRPSIAYVLEDVTEEDEKRFEWHNLITGIDI